MKGIPKEGKHEALADILESIDELRYYREHFLKL
jgi:oligoribonuclease